MNIGDLKICQQCTWYREDPAVRAKGRTLRDWTDVYCGELACQTGSVDFYIGYIQESGEFIPNKTFQIPEGRNPRPPHLVRDCPYKLEHMMAHDAKLKNL